MFITRYVSRIVRVFIDHLVITFQLFYGLWYLSKLKEPIVTIFGGSRLAQDDPYAQITSNISHDLVEAGFSVLTGGGPGVMQAANCGAILHKGKGLRSMGVSVEGLDDEESNVCVEKLIVMRNFPSRKWLLTRYSAGFVVMPGGFGTLDEMAEVITLIQTKRMKDKPIVLFGKEYWQSLMDWVNNSALRKGLVSKDDIRLLDVTDEPHEAVCLIRGRCELIFPEDTDQGSNKESN